MSDNQCVVPSRVTNEALLEQLSCLTKQTTALLGQVYQKKCELDAAVVETQKNTAEVRGSSKHITLLNEQLAKLVTDAEQALRDATAIVYGGSFSVVPSAGAAVVADGDGRIRAGWLPKEWEGLLQSVGSLESFAIESIRNSTINFTQILKLGEKLSEFTQQQQVRNQALSDTRYQVGQLNKKTKQLGINQELLTYTAWSMFDHVRELNRMAGQSGVVRARAYEYGGSKAYHQPTSTGYSPYLGHDHGNIENLVGTGEFSVMADGIYVRTRHNDDGLWMPCKVGDDFNHRQKIVPPAEPADIAAAKTPEEKIALAEKYLQIMAGQLPQSAVGDYANAAQWVMTGVEVYPEVYQHGESLRDPFSGHRHQINVSTLPALFKQEAFYGNGGHKNIRENSLHIAAAVNDVDEKGNPVVVLWRYRFISAPVGSLAEYPVDDLLDYFDDNANHQRYDYSQEQMQNSRQARFRIKQRLGQSNVSHFHQPELIDELIAKIPGFDGYGNQLTEAYQYYGVNDQLKAYGTQEPLKAGYYSRWYTMSNPDASNRRNVKRGFTDDKLWVARTTHSRVKQTSFGHTKLGFTYFVPLELHIQSFLNGNFNVWGVKDVSRQFSYMKLRQMYQEGYGRSERKPMPGYNNFFYFYKNPEDLFDTAVPTDGADTTVPGGIWFQCADGKARKHFPSGYGYFLPTTQLLGQPFRTRFPIYFAHFEGSEAFKYIEAAREEQCSLAAAQVESMRHALKAEARAVAAEQGVSV